MTQRFRGKVGLQRVGTNVDPSQANYTRSIRDQMQAIEKNLSKFIDSVTDVSAKVLEDAFTPTFNKAKEYTPKDTHALVDSGYIVTSPSAKGAKLELGFGKGGKPSYTVFVHERTDMQHAAPTRAKFLQAALEEDAKDIQDRIVSGYKKESGI